MTEKAYLPVFSTPAAEAETMAEYQALLARWPVPYTELMIPTSFGDTHVIASGPLGAPPVILLHAYFAGVLAWAPTAAHLSGDFRVYAVDMLGEPGASRPTKAIKTLDDQLQWQKELTDGLGAPEAHVIGNSFGGYCGMAYALHMPERVRKLVLIGPAATIHGMPKFYWNCFLPKALLIFFPWLPGIQRLVLRSVDWLRSSAPTDPAWENVFRKYMLYGTGARYVFPSVFPPEALAKVKTPTLLLVGEKEVIYPPEKAIAAARKHIPNVQTALIPNCNHIAAVSQPERIHAEIRKFLCED